MSNTRNASKKLHERMYLDGFLAQTDWSASVRGVKCGESPDFVLGMAGGCRRGVEVVSVFVGPGEHGGGSTERRQEALADRWITDLAESYYRRCSVPLAVDFYSFEPLSDELREATLQTLTGAARALDCETVERTRFEVTNEHQAPRAILHVRRIRDEIGEYRRWRYMNDRVSWRRAFPSGYIQSVIDEKARKLPAYREGTDEVYLLLVADAFRRSGIVDVEVGIAKNRGFDAIYFFRYPDGGASRLA